jgi:hypothetical protein
VTRTPRWLTETTAWTAAVVLVAGVVSAVSLQGHQPAAQAAARSETPAVQTFREVHIKVPVPAATAPVEATTPRRTAPAALPALGPPPGPQYDAPPAQTAPPEQRYAFLAGITHYRAPTHNTIGGANDVRFIAAQLERSGWLPQNIRVVTDGAATGSAIRSGLSWLAAKSTPGTFTFFHYSGHVKQVGDTEKLWPVDRDFINDSEMGGLLSRGTGKMWVDIAGCEAAGFMGSLPSSRVLFSASSESHEKSYEYPDWGKSVWAGLLFDLGTSQGGADADHNGRVTIGEALRYATYYAHSITMGQSPYGPQIPQVAGDPVRGWTLADPPA